VERPVAVDLDDAAGPIDGEAGQRLRPLVARAAGLLRTEEKVISPSLLMTRTRSMPGWRPMDRMIS
jgi:hypothetical protein